MRVELIFTVRGEGRMLPMDYQYALSSWVYGVIRQSDSDFSSFLHDRGYADGNKRFKFFTVSELNLYPFKAWRERKVFEVLENTFKVQLSFLVDRAYREFVKGLFLRQRGTLGDRFSRVEFEVTGIRSLASPVFGEVMRYRSVSPLFLKVREESGRVVHLSPEDKRYEDALFGNLREKCRTLALHGEGEAVLEREDFGFRLLRTRGSRILRLHPYTEREIRNRVYHLDFELRAPVAVQEVAYFAGLGADCSMGCGMLSVLDESR
ncbi:CRISPR-associated endoribonuclease (plasmid) [Fulvitalea axinellae]|uniref:CRISPR-associated endoribonuclease n=1 Tax=Fulvitalea axinellae TaxID=1182444 RepID=A0AAU9CYB7_9BACT|nr:CRISPR-associated endoribonuclease [Fulvitalea axinellae]